MSIYKGKRRGTWISWFQFKNRAYKKAGFTSKSDALAWEGNKRKELEAPPPLQTPTVSFQELATAYLDDCKLRMQLNTYRTKRSCYRRFLGHLEADLPVDSISKKAVADFLQQRALKDGNISSNRDLKELTALFHWATQKEITTADPTRGLSRYPETKALRYVPSVQDIAAVRLAAVKGDESDLIETLYYTAARLGEIAHYRPDSGARAITWDDINFEQGWIRLWTRKRRGGELQEDRLPMSPSLKALLERRWKRRNTETPFVFEFQEKELRGVMARLCGAAKVTEFTFHSIRHHVLSLLNDSGKLSLKQVQLFARHKKQATTENYLRSMRPFDEAALILEKYNSSNSEADSEKGDQGSINILKWRRDRDSNPR